MSGKPKTSKHSPRNLKRDRKPTSKSASDSKTEGASKSVVQRDASKPTALLTDDTKSTNKREISICVLDDSKNRSETFMCEYNVLVNKMPYFKNCLDAEPDGELTISVHCDIAVFKVIMDYITEDSLQESKKFQFDPKLAIHLLVSADFLEMSTLVDECLSYCHRHMNSIIESNCPVGALNDCLLGRLASLFSHREIEALTDSSGRIKEKLYKVLLESFLKPDREIPVKSGLQRLFKCSLCDQTFSPKLQSCVSCKNKKAIIGCRGELVHGQHKRDINWNIDKYVEDSFQSLKSWRKLYWKTWGLVNVLYCTTCQLYFSCSEFTRCRFHNEDLVPPTLPLPTRRSMANSLVPLPLNANDHEMGTFPCCGAKSWKFDPLNPLQLATGCAYRNHTVSSADRASDVFQDMLTYSDLICLLSETKVPPTENHGLSRIMPFFSERAVAQWSHASNLDILIKTGSKQSISSEGSGSVTTKSSESLTVGFSRKELKQPAIFTSVLCAVGQTYGASDLKQLWKPGGSLWHNQDAVREHDNRQMELMMLQFQKLRNANRLRGSSPRKP